MHVNQKTKDGWNIIEVVSDNKIMVQVIEDQIDPSIKHVALDEKFMEGRGSIVTDLNRPVYSDNINLIPSHMQDGILRYIEDGIRGGAFMTAVLSNQLQEAFQLGDQSNIEAMQYWVTYLYNYAPRDCYGSPEAVDYWVSVGGKNGIDRNFKQPKTESEK